METTLSETQAFINVLLRAWTQHITRTTDLFESLTDEQILQPIAPGRNRGVYVLGHLVATHDGMLPLLDLGKRNYPDLEPIFNRTPDNPSTPIPSVAELRTYWKNVNAQLLQHFEKMQPEEWLAKHTVVSAEDFAKEPHRNKLSILVSRTNHVGYHLGQLVWLKKGAAD